MQMLLLPFESLKTIFKSERCAFLYLSYPNIEKETAWAYYISLTSTTSLKEESYLLHQDISYERIEESDQHCLLFFRDQLYIFN